MESPIRVQADLSKGLNAWLTLLPEGMRAVGNRLTEEYDHWRDSRRMRNIVTAVEIAVPDMDQDATSPDDDWLTEWFDLASKRSTPDWQKAMAKMLASESNAPGTVPLRYFVDMARLDKAVIDEFGKVCGYYLPSIKDICQDDPNPSDILLDANLVRTRSFGFVIPIRKKEQYKRLYVPCPGEDIYIQNGDYNLPAGNSKLTNFGSFVYSLLDPKPPPAPGLADSVRALWKDYLYEEDAAE